MPSAEPGPLPAPRKDALGARFAARPLASRDETDSTVLYDDPAEGTEAATPVQQEDATTTTTVAVQDGNGGGDGGDGEGGEGDVPADPAPEQALAELAKTDDYAERGVVTVRFMDNLLPDTLVVNPVVRFWIVDGYTGQDVTHTAKGEPSAYGGYYCNPCDLREAKGYTARWDEAVYLNLSIAKLLKVCPDAMLLFEVIDCSRVNVQRQVFYRRNYGPGYGRVFYPVCWGFLKLKGVDGESQNCSGRRRVQLYRTPLRRSLLKVMMLKLWPASVYPSSAVASVPGYVQPGASVPPLFHQYMMSQNRLDKYPATLHISIDSEEEAFHRAPRVVPRDLEKLLLDCRRVLSPLQQSLMNHRRSQLSHGSDVQAIVDEPIEIPDCTRKRGEKCVVPHFLQASLSGGEKGCLALVFSPCGRYLAIAACDEHNVEIRVHDTKFGPVPTKEDSRAGRLACPQIAAFDGHASTVYSLVWSPGGKHLISCSADNTVKQWPFEKVCHFEWQNYATVNVLEEAVRDGSIVATSGAEFTFLHPCHVYTAVCHPLGEMLLTGGFDDTIRGWSMVSGRLILSCKATPKSWVSHLALTSDGSMLYAADGNSELKLWTLSGLTRAAKAPKLDHWATIEDFKGKGISCLRVHTAAKQLYVWTRVDSCVTCINTSTYSRFSQVKKYRGPRFESCALKGCLSPCGTVVASGSSGGSVFFWNTSTAEYVDHDHTGLNFEHSGPVYSTAWSPTDHRMAFSSYSARLNLVTVWYSPAADEEGEEDEAVKVTNVASSRALDSIAVARVGSTLAPAPSTLTPNEEPLDDENWMDQIIVKWTDRVTKRAQKLVTAGTAVEVHTGNAWRQANVTGWSADGLCTVEYSDASGGAASVLPVNMRRLRASSNSGLLVCHPHLTSPHPHTNYTTDQPPPPECDGKHPPKVAAGTPTAVQPA